MKRALVWFKTDLRLHDNETLVQAINHNDEIIPVYCFDESHFLSSEFGSLKTGNFRFQFLIESLVDLDVNLRKLGSGLTVVYGKPEIALTELAVKYNAQRVFAKKEVAFEEKQTQGLVEKELWKIKCLLETYSTSTLYHAQDLPFALRDIPDVFTNFRKRIERDGIIRKVTEMPTLISSPAIEVLNLPVPEKFGLKKVTPDDRKVFNFQGGETAGINRLNSYLFSSNAIATYKETRNGMLGENYSSKFSPWLGLGCLSPREIYEEIKKYEREVVSNDSTYWLIFELLWRDYFRFMMKKHGHLLFLKNGISKQEAIVRKQDAKLFKKWILGETGNDFIDANMIELKKTGFMSNRGRQNVASYFCHELKLDWRYGAAYFEEQLIDYDVCSNWGNWAYLAGVGNDPRDGRIFNTEKQASDYDKNGNYRKLWLGEL